MTTTVAHEALEYGTAVREALADVEPAVLEELVDGLETHLEEVATEGGAPLVELLGPPDGYAAELRASAGVREAPPRPGPPGAARPPGTRRSADGPTSGAGGPPGEATPGRDVPFAGFVRAGRELAPSVRPWVVPGALALVALIVFTRVWSSADISAGELALAVALALAAGAIGRAIVRRVTWPDGWASRAAAAVAGATVVGAALLGSWFGGHRELVYVDTTSATTAPFPSVGDLVDVTGLSLGPAVEVLSASGWAVVTRPMVGRPGQAGLVVMQDPPAGTWVDPGQTVVLYVGTADAPTPPTASPDPSLDPSAPVTATTVPSTAPITVTAPAPEITTAPTVPVTAATTPITAPGTVPPEATTAPTTVPADPAATTPATAPPAEVPPAT